MELTQDSISVVLIGFLVIVAVLFVLSIIAKLFRIAIAIAVLSVLVPILFTIFWGDGTEYIESLTSFLTPTHQERIEEAYQYYRDKSTEDEVLDYDAVSKAVTNVFDDNQDGASD